MEATKYCSICPKSWWLQRSPRIEGWYPHLPTDCVFDTATISSTATSCQLQKLTLHCSLRISNKKVLTSWSGQFIIETSKISAQIWLEKFLVVTFWSFLKTRVITGPLSSPSLEPNNLHNSEHVICYCFWSTLNSGNSKYQTNATLDV